MNQYDVIIKKLTEQIGELSKESAIYYSLYLKAQQEIKELKEQLNDKEEVKDE